jgi:hypothetical protein
MNPTRTITAKSYLTYDSSHGGSFYRFKCVDEDGKPAVCKMDMRFKSLVQPVIDAIDAGEIGQLVVIDNGNPSEYRISLDYYRNSEAEDSEPLSSIEAEVSSIDTMRRITLSVPAEEHAYLHQRWKQEKQLSPGLTFEAYTRRLFLTLLAPLKVLSS